MILWHPDALGGLRFHLRLAIISLRRDRSVTAAAILCLALGSGIWTMTVTHYLRTYPLAPALPSGLHTVGQPYWLRSFAAWRPLFVEPTGEMDFYLLLSALGLAGAAFSVSRLLLAKGLARRSELAVYRALGATRATLFWTQMLEAALLAIPATAMGLASAGAQHAFYNRFAADNDIPVALDGTVVLIGVVTAIAVSFLAALYPAWRTSRTPPTVYLGRL